VLDASGTEFSLAARNAGPIKVVIDP